MGYLANNCVVVKPSEIMITGAGGSKNMVAITFDDGFVSVKEHAIPVLKEFGLSAGVFVPTGNLGQRCSWEVLGDTSDVDGVIINADHILELDKDGFEIFSHTCSHPLLAEVNDSDLETELVESKNLLEEIVGHEVIAISYPYGVCDIRVRKAAEKAGYKLGFTIEPELVNGEANPLEIGRFSVSPRYGLLKFKLKISGAYRVTKYLHRLKSFFVKA